MPPYQQRVITERSELLDKTEKLGVFLSGTIFNSVALDEQSRLIKQYAFMKLYLEILDERIAAWRS